MLIRLQRFQGIV